MNRSDGRETRKRLLDAAGAVFAAKGFHDAKTADICRLGKANGAAVNYYFGSKEALYVAAWRHEFERSLTAYPPDGGVPPAAPAAQRLRGHIQALVGKFMDPASRDLDISHREMANPTGLLGEVMARSIEPLRQTHVAIVRELLGPRTTGRQIQLCEMSIHAQCFAALMQERHRRNPPKGFGRAGPVILDIGREVLVDHIVRFSLAGIREVRRQGGAGTGSARAPAGKGGVG